MAQKTKRKRRKGKPGPREERLVISNPQAAIDSLLRKKPAK